MRKTFIKRNPITIIVIFTMLTTLLSCSKVNRYVNKKIGYEITGPADWHTYPSPTGSVSFAKYKTKKYGNSNINVFIEPLNPQAQTPLDYLNWVLLPQVQQIFDKAEDWKIKFLVEPYSVERNGYEWAVVKYWLPEDTLQIAYVVFSGKNVFMVVLNSIGPQHVENEDLFLDALDTFKIYY